MKSQLTQSFRVWALLAGCWMGAWVPAAPARVRPKEGVWQIANFAEDAGIAWHKVEATDGTVFAEGSSNLLVCSEGRGRVVSGGAFPLCRTREGEVVSLWRDPAGSSFFFTRWNGTEFIQASAGITAGGIFWEVMRQAPDGTVLHWEYHESEWTAFEGLAPPCFVDRKGQLWFADGERTVVQRGSGFETVPDVRLPMIQDGRGFVWGKIPGGVAWAEGEPDRGATFSFSLLIDTLP